MILHALNAYYDRLQCDPEVDVAPFGFSRQKIAFRVVVNLDGSLHAIEDIRDHSGKNPMPLNLIVPGGAKPPGQGINPGFLWDNTAYMLGYKPDDPKPDRTRQSFEAFRDRHLGLEETVKDPGFSAVCRFLKGWDTGLSQQYPLLTELQSGFGIFGLRGETQHIHSRPAIQAWWQSQLSLEGDSPPKLGQCLVTGSSGPLARLHEPKIKGVLGAQSSGAAIVSFNDRAYESFGRQQGDNSPVSQAAAFQYCTALNHLLRSGSRQRLQIGDATTVFWSEAPSAAESWLPIALESTSADDQALNLQLKSILDSVAAGAYPPELGDPETRFYILGLSPNASRLSIRFWNVSSVGELVRHLHQHFNDLAMVHRDADPDFPPLWLLLRQTARESKDIPPLLAGAMLRAVLTGARYPELLYTAVLRRIRADRQVSYLRAALLKACLNRESRLGTHPSEKELPVSLDIHRPEPAYQLGRLFAELEKTQEDALPGINDTIKDRYFGAAAATPASVFPRLIRMSQHHLGKLEKGGRNYHEKRIQEICGRLNEFPSHHTLRDQGLFAIGYYHQRQDIFTKKSIQETSTQMQEQDS